MTWACDDLEGCTISWKESGGPPVVAPTRQGFGSVLIDRSISYDLGGESEVRYLKPGLEAKFRIPARHVKEAGRPIAAPITGAAAAPRADADLSKARVLIVEDELLIAMNLEQILADAGVTEVMTASSSKDALDLLRTFKPDVAILDVNLGSGTSAAVAEELAARGIPFMLTTGYGEGASLSETFADATIINKPYEASAVIAAVSQLMRRG